MSTFKKIAICVLAAWLAANPALQNVRAQQQPGRREFFLSFWCGPPDPYITPQQYKRIKDAGFNCIMPPCEGRASVERNRKILNTARDVGLKAFVEDERMPLAITGVEGAREKLDAIVADYSRHPAFAGYYLTDEPSALAFSGLAEIVAYLRDKDPRHPSYINLFPNYASAQQLGTATYEQHVEQYIKVVQPDMVSYDHYNFVQGSDRPGFFANLDVVRRLSRQYETPFWQIVLALPHLDYRMPNEAEKRWTAMHTLAYGGTGLLYFTYWRPSDSAGEPTIMTYKGEPTRQYDEVKRINADVRAIGRYLVDADSLAVFHNGELLDEGARPREPGIPILFPGPEDVTVGYFRARTQGGATGETLYALLVNRKYHATTETRVFFATGTKTLERLNRKTLGWINVGRERAPDGSLKVNLAAGDAELFRWKN